MSSHLQLSLKVWSSDFLSMSSEKEAEREYGVLKITGFNELNVHPWLFQGTFHLPNIPQQ